VILHEAFQAPGTRADRVHVPKSPPPPIADRPTNDRPDPRAQWVSGYWAWDPARKDFVWVSGTWRIPPNDSIWVGGRWMRDADGWYRVPGVWSRRQGLAPAPLPRVETASQAGWRTTGPPADHPDDTPGAAPGPDYFFVPGHYSPEGDHLTWTSGFWARVQPGWDWIPARWVRRPDGWDYREGYWTRDPGLPPAIVRSEPAGTGAGPGRDLIGEAEANAPVATPVPAPPVVVAPRVNPPIGYRYGVPMSVIRPPGSYPYGPAGVVVPAATPPFVQRLLDRVLP
jgi:hypothetical protein